MARRIPPFLKRLAACLPVILLALATLATVGAPLGIWSSHIERLTHFRIWWLVLLLVLVVYFARRDRMATMFLTIGIAAWSLRPLLPYWFTLPLPSSHSINPPLRVIAWNVLWENPRKAEALAWLQSQDADLILLTERTLDWQRAMTPLEERYPHHIHSGRDGAEGMWLLSRYPLDAPDPEGLATNKPWISTIVHSPAGAVRILGMHSRTPRSGARFDERNEQYDKAAAIVAAERNPAILMGDLNCTPFSPWFERLLDRGGLMDSAWGRGITGTWSSQGIRLPIDHILVSKGLIRVIDRRVESDFRGSDHRPVTATLALQRGR